MATADTAEPNVPVPSTETSLGKLSATPPVALSASGGQSGTTRSAIAAGTIIVGGEAVSPVGLSRDTASANDGALTQEFDAAKRDEINQGFTAARLLVSEVGTYFAYRAQEQEAKRREAERQLLSVDKGIEYGDDLQPLRDKDGKTIALSETQRQLYLGDTNNPGSIAKLKAEEERLGNTYGAGSTARLCQMRFLTSCIYQKLSN